MMAKRPQLEAGFVLHHRPYRDSSLILDVFSREHGRLALVARGARRPGSRQRGLLQAFRPLLLSWRLGGEMGSLTAVESAGPAFPLRGEALLAGFYLNELLLRLTGRQDPNPELFAVYATALHGLSGDDRETAPVLRQFEMRTLACIGYSLPLFETAVDGSPLLPDRRYRFDSEEGARLLPETEGERGYAGQTLLAMARDDWSQPAVLPEARRLLAAALEPHLGGRPLKTARVLRDLRRHGFGARGRVDKGEDDGQD